MSHFPMAHFTFQRASVNCLKFFLAANVIKIWQKAKKSQLRLLKRVSAGSDASLKALLSDLITAFMFPGLLPSPKVLRDWLLCKGGQTEVQVCSPGRAAMGSLTYLRSWESRTDEAELVCSQTRSLSFELMLQIIMWSMVSIVFNSWII